MLSAARTNRLRFGRSPLIPGGSQFDRAGSLAFLAPMPLRAIQALPHSAIIANENLFSHANLVSTTRPGVCQALFSGRLAIGSASQGSRSEVWKVKKRLFSVEKSLPGLWQFLQCASNPELFAFLL